MISPRNCRTWANDRTIVLRDRKDGSLFCISFDENGSNLEFISRQEANKISQRIAHPGGFANVEN